MRKGIGPGRLLAVCAMFACATAGIAQTKPFSSGQAEFLSEMTSFMVEGDKKEGKPFMELTFTPAWNSGYISDAQRASIADRANALLKKRFTAFPHFHQFLSVIVTFATEGRSKDEFDIWLRSMEAMEKSRKKDDLRNYLETCHGLLDKGVLYSSASTTWRARGGTFRFTFDSVPSFTFERMDLVGMAKGDSTVILGTKGTYLPIEEHWHGMGGKVTWERAGLEPTSTFAEWDHGYEIRMKSATFEVDSVEFTDPYFERTLLGTLVDKVLANVEEDNASYPRFESYDRRMRIREIVEGIDFDGGFSMRGAKLQGYGTEEEPAFLTFYRDKRPFIITSGLRYSIEPTRISSEQVSVRIYLDKDSLFHPSTSLRFLREKKLLSLIKGEAGLGRGPFYDTFHQLDMFFEVLTWKQGDPVVQMGNLQGSTQTRASFESFDFFKEARYNAMLGMDAIHPMVRLNDYMKQSGPVFSAQDFAVYTRLQKQQVIPMLIDMANKGYLDYDIQEEIVQMKPRLRQHILASAGKVDYDVLQFNSNSDDGVNATLNLLNNDLTLHGVARIILSDSQDVRIYPGNREVVVKKGRDFTFSGAVQAGKLTFHGKEYYFHYDPFVVDLLNVDSVSFKADSFEPSDRGETFLVPVKNVLESVTGTLEVDAPTNKSGLLQKDYPEYPKFNSTKESFVYYDRKAIQKGVYDRDRFYYRSDPFQIDSLDNFTNEGLTFTGTLVSAGIFPDIVEPIRLQTDYSLGFVRSTGEGGLPLYGRKSKFGNVITLNYKGLQGDGDITYLTTLATSKRLVFCPDSTFGIADTLYNGAAKSPTMNVPNVHAAGVFLRLEPARDVLYAERRAKPMEMYDGQAYLYGHTELRPSGMTGGGLVDFTNATLSSTLFDFQTMKLHADTSDFRLTEGDTASIAFRTDNVNATVKLDERVGEFVSNGSETKVEFPVNQYICYMDRFKWYMDQGDIELESDRTAAESSEDLQLSGSNFISTRADQDSLSFMAPKARYDLKKHLITATDVQYIQVADALIAPDSSVVRIRKNAAMDPLNNAVITANKVTKHHTIKNATVNIASKRQYSASGEVDYVDEDQKAFTIRLQNINVDTSYQTYARGRILEAEQFQLSPAFDYFGEVLLEANRKDLLFTGSTRIQHGCSGLERNWMTFSAEIDPKEVFIPVSDTLRDTRGEAIGAGVYLTSTDPFNTYGTFLSRKEEPKDPAVISSSGFLYFDKAKREYMISSKEKIRQRSLPGDLVSLNVDECRIDGDGHISAAVDLGRVSLENIGSLRSSADSGTTANVVMMADFHFLDNALERMVAEITAYPEQKQVDIGKTYYEKMLREVLGLERSDKLISELSIKGEIKKLPDELVRSLVLCDVRMQWDKRNESWVSTGPIGIGTVLKKPVFRYVKGKIELERKRSGDSMTILLMLDDQTFYFFQYSRNYLYTYSSDEQFNTMLTEVKEDKTKLESRKDQPDYRYMVTNRRKVNEFRDRFGL